MNRRSLNQLCLILFIYLWRPLCAFRAIQVNSRCALCWALSGQSGRVSRKCSACDSMCIFLVQKWNEQTKMNMPFIANPFMLCAHFTVLTDADRMTNPLHCLFDRFDGNGSSSCPLKLQFHLREQHFNGFQSNPSVVVKVCTATLTLTILTTLSRTVPTSRMSPNNSLWWLSSRHSVSSCSQWYPQTCS